MAEMNLKQIIDRLNAEFSGDIRKLVFWYDESVEICRNQTNRDRNENPCKWCECAICRGF